jgi:hypothetical protein
VIEMRNCWSATNSPAQSDEGTPGGKVLKSRGPYLLQTDMIGWARQLAFYDLHMLSLETGVPAVHELISGPQPVQQMWSRDWDQ